MKSTQMKRIFTLLTALLLSATAATAAETGSTENLARAAVPLEGEGVQDWFQVPGRPIVQGSDALNDGRPETAVAFPAGRNASVGLEWVRELFVGRLVVRFAGAVPPRPTTVDFYNGGKWLTLDKNLEFTEAREGGALGWAVTFEPRVMEKIRLRWDVLAAGIRVAEIEAYESETLAPLEFLAKHPGRNVDEEIMALPGDPSYHDLAIRALSRPASTYVGEGMLCAWNGMMEKPGSLAVTVGKERRMLGYGPLKGNTLARRPLKGYLPVVEVVAYEDGLCYWQASLSPQPFEVLAAVRVTNTRKEPVAAEFAVSWWYQDERGKLLPTPGISAVDGGNGTMLDHTTILFLSDSGDGHHPQLRTWPMVVLGNLGGRLKTGGRYLEFPGYGLANHRTIGSLYSTLLHAAGQPRAKFGLDDIALKDVKQGAPLPELLA